MISRLERLVEELCPGGVEFVSLGNSCHITTGKLDANAQTENGIYPFFTCNENPLKIDTFAFDAEAIIVSGNGSKVGHVNYFKGKFNAYQRTYILMNFENFDVGFLLHYVKGYLRPYIDKHSKKGSVPYITMPMLSNFDAPCPPLPIQRKIVQVLDNFTELSAELNTELTARKRQYEYYRGELLTFGDDVPVVSLGVVAQYSKARIGTTELSSDNYVGVDNLLPDKRGKTASNYVPQSGAHTRFDEGDVLIGNIRPYLKKIWLADITGGTNGDVLVVHLTKDTVLPRFLYHVLSSDIFFAYNMQYAKGAKMPRGSKEAIMQYEIPVPSLEEQERVISVLERFEVLVNDITNGLPAEIAARQRQYEYYRDKLLTFKEATS